MSKQYTWESELNKEMWQHDCFNSPTDCILDAVENYGYKSGETIYIGVTVDFGINVDATDVLEKLEEEAYEFAESAEDWNTFNYKEDKKELDELSEQLSDVIIKWLEKHNNMPNFYQVIDVQPFKI